MAKLSQIKLGNTTYDIGAAWDNISGKPSSFPPSSHNHDFITYKDTRADNQSPNDVQAGLTVHLKANGTDGISDGGSYHAVLNVKDWGDYSGGPYWQSTVTANNNMHFRISTAGTTWGSWQKVLSDNNYTNYTVTKTGSGASGTWGINVTGRARFLETKHQDGSAWYGDNYPLYAQWETSNICKIKCDNYYTKVDYADSATKATQDGSGNVITSKYVTLDTAQTISGTKTMTGSLKVSGRYAGGGDDEGIIVGFADNGYAGLCLGGPSEARSVFYFKSDGSSPFWRYNNGSASYDILHPSKSGTIALTGDLDGYAKLASPNNLIHSGNEFTFASDAYSGDLFINYRTANNAQNGNITTYRFCKGAGGTLSNIAADTFIGKLNGKADSAGYADSAGTCTSLSTNAGSATKAIYFSGGKPAQCNNTLNHNISGNANTASLWALTGTANTTTGHSDWDGGVGNTNKYTVYDQEWACSSIGADTGDLRVFLRPGEYSSGGTEVCFAIDGDYYVMGNKVLHAGNYTNYAAQKSHTHTISQVTWGASENLACTGDNSEWSVDMQSSAPNSYFHIWSGYLGNSCMTFSNKTGKCHAPYGVSGAVWNDYAEYRNQLEEIEPGYCVTANDKGEVFKTSFRLQACDGVVSDTFGFSIGETEKAKTPLAVAGRVLVYCGDERSIYHFGDCVCAGPNGLAYKMTEEEIQKYPHRIIGTVSEIPDYEIWGTGNVPVNNRIWIKVK